MNLRLRDVVEDLSEEHQIASPSVDSLQVRLIVRYVDIHETQFRHSQRRSISSTEMKTETTNCLEENFRFAPCDLSLFLSLSLEITILATHISESHTRFTRKSISSSKNEFK